MYIMSNFRFTAAPIFHLSTISAAMKPAKMDERSAKKTKAEKEKAALAAEKDKSDAEKAKLAAEITMTGPHAPGSKCPNRMRRWP